MMKRWKRWIPVIASAAMLAGCGPGQNPNRAGQEQNKTGTATEALVQENSEMTETEMKEVHTNVAEVEPVTPDFVEAAAGTEEGKILIAYFTWADNTHVEDPSSVDLDASTSASVLPPGNAALLAGWISQEVGGDLFSIKVEEPYSSDYDKCLDRAADEKADNARPALNTHVENMEDYEIVFLGFPNWWYTLPMPVLSFVEEYDFSGKTVVPFCTHGTGGLAATIEDLKKALPDSTRVLDPIGVYRQEVQQAQPDIQEWVEGLDL